MLNSGQIAFFECTFMVKIGEILLVINTVESLWLCLSGRYQGSNYLSDSLDTRKIREDALRRMAQGSVSPYARRSDPSGLCSVPGPFAGGVGYPAVRGYRYEGHTATGTAGKGGFNLADFGKELLTGFVAGGLSSAAFYGAGKAVEAVKGSVRSAGKGGSNTINPNDIRFSQSSVNGSDEIVESMRNNGWAGDTLDVVRMPDGGLTTIDNTRVVAARQAGIDVQANIHAYDDLLPSEYIDRFTTKKGVPTTWGDAITLRIGKQNATFRNNNPFGSVNMDNIK